MSHGDTHSFGYMDESFTLLISKTTFVKPSNPTFIATNCAQTCTTTIAF